MTPEIQPLIGRTVLVTRPRGSGQRLPRELRRQGARVVWQPTVHLDDRIATPELDAALDRLDDFDWVIFTSPRSVAVFWRQLVARGVDRSVLHSKDIAVVGPGTDRALEDRGVKARLVGRPHSAAGLLSVLTPLFTAKRHTVLFPRAAAVGPALATGLRELGTEVVEVVAYRTEPLHSRTALTRTLSGRVDCIVFCSPSAIHAAVPFRAHLDQCAIACIGSVTAAAAATAGFAVSIVPPEPTMPALARAIAAHFAEVSA